MGCVQTKKKNEDSNEQELPIPSPTLATRENDACNVPQSLDPGQSPEYYDNGHRVSSIRMIDSITEDEKRLSSADHDGYRLPEDIALEDEERYVKAYNEYDDNSVFTHDLNENLEQRNGPLSPVAVGGVPVMIGYREYRRRRSSKTGAEEEEVIIHDQPILDYTEYKEKAEQFARQSIAQEELEDLDRMLEEEEFGMSGRRSFRDESTNQGFYRSESPDQNKMQKKKAMHGANMVPEQEKLRKELLTNQKLGVDVLKVKQPSEFEKEVYRREARKEKACDEDNKDNTLTRRLKQRASRIEQAEKEAEQTREKHGAGQPNEQEQVDNPGANPSFSSSKSPKEEKQYGGADAELSQILTRIRKSLPPENDDETRGHVIYAN